MKLSGFSYQRPARLLSNYSYADPQSQKAMSGQKAEP
jgi:hypothetical protein